MRKDCVARELTMEAIVGVFMIMVLLGLGYFTIILSSNKIFKKEYPINITFQRVMGIRNGDSIVVRGMTAGKVTDIELSNDGVLVTGTLDAELILHEGYKISIAQTSILGGRQLEIDTGPLNAKKLSPETVFTGVIPHDIMADAGEVINALKASMVDGNAIANLSKAADNFYEISERLNRGEGLVGKLLSSDETMYNDISGSMASLRKLTERLESGKGTLGRLLSEDDTLYNDLASTMASLKTVTKHLEDGDGLLGKMLTDDQLYNQLSGIINEAMEVLDDYRETSPVVTFTSIFFGAL